MLILSVAKVTKNQNILGASINKFLRCLYDEKSGINQS